MDAPCGAAPLCARAALLDRGGRAQRLRMNEPVETSRRSLAGAPLLWALAAAASAAVAALLIVGGQNGARQSAEAVPRGCITETGALGGPIDLVDGAGAAVSEAAFAGRPALVYFGFTHCPDICPTTMYTLAEAMALPRTPDAQAVLITLDPERDTPETMAAYARTGGFPEGLVGLTGSRAQIDAAIAAFRVTSIRAPIEGAPADVYNVDHSSFLYVLDGQWRLRAIYNTIAGTPQDMAACVATGLARG